MSEDQHKHDDLELPPPSRQADLRGLFRAASPVVSGAVGGPPRPVIRVVEPGGARRVEAEPLRPAGFVDGVQASLQMVREHRPIAVAWVAAGAAMPPRQLVTFRQHLSLVCCYRDSDYARSIAHGLPVHTVDEALPWDVEVAIGERIRRMRAQLERQILAGTPRLDGVLVVDGSIRGYDRDDVIGVVKSTATPWLSDLTALPYTLAWRSPAFLIPATRRGERDVFCAYLRLRTPHPQRHSWSHGLIRVETPALEEIDAACALAVAGRQPEGATDRRADVHLAAMLATERILRAFMPQVYDVLG